MQERKLRNLGFVCDDGIPHDKVLFNYSNRVLSSVEKTAPSKGLNFVISNSKRCFTDHFLSFEKVFF